MKSRHEISLIISHVAKMRERAANMLAEADKAEQAALAELVEVVLRERRVRFEVGKIYTRSEIDRGSNRIGDEKYKYDGAIFRRCQSWRFPEKAVTESQINDPGSFGFDIVLQFYPTDKIGRKKAGYKPIEIYLNQVV